MSLRSVQSITAMPPPQNAANMRLPRIMGGPCKVQAVSAGRGSLPEPLPFRLLPRQAPDAHHLGSERIAHVQGPDDAPVPAVGVVREERELAGVVDAEAVRPA